MDDHPLAHELAARRRAAARFQHDALAAAAALHRHTADAARRTAALEHDNAALARELAVLRAHPDAPPPPAHAHELALALRRLSDRAALTEDALRTRTAELADARAETRRAAHAADTAYALAARMRAREEAAAARTRELELAARAAEDERRMVDLVVQQYADLVRRLEGRTSAAPAPVSLQDALQQGKEALFASTAALSAESQDLHATIAALNAQVSDLQVALDAERASAAHDRALLTQAQDQLDKLDLEDQTAAKIVTRYMKFSQASTNALQQQVTTLRTRHAATVTTLQAQLSVAESQLASERTLTARLQDALDELCQDLARESYGRRREVSLRLALLSREEAVAESMRRWARRAAESYARCCPRDQPEDPIQEAFCRVVTDAQHLLASFDDDVEISDLARTSGSLARMVLSSEAVQALRDELQDETRKRIEAIHKFFYPASEERSNGDPSSITTLPINKDTISTPDDVHIPATISLSTPVPTTSPAGDQNDMPMPVPEDDAPKDDQSDQSAPVSEGDAPKDAQSAPVSPPVLLSEIKGAQHRHDALQRAFRDCSVALKDLKRALSSSSPSIESTALFRHHLETALARIEDYAEDARVELEIQIADEALTAQGFLAVLSVLSPDRAVLDTGAHDERVEIEANARAFVDGTEDGVQKATERFTAKLEDVQHDIAVVKRALHRLAIGEEAEGDLVDTNVDADSDADSDAQDESDRIENGDANMGWTAWTAGFLGSTPAPPRSPTPVAQTFGAVMTSPRPRPREVRRRRRGKGPLAGLDLRVPMPVGFGSSSSPPFLSAEHGPYGQVGLGHPMNGRASLGAGGLVTRTVSTMYAVGGLRSASSLGLGMGVGVGLGGSATPPVRRTAGSVSSTGLGTGEEPVRVSARRHEVKIDVDQDAGGHDKDLLQDSDVE